MEASLVHTCPDTSKIDPFNGTLFKRWQERVFSAIDVVNLGHILAYLKPEDSSHLLPTWKIGKTPYGLWKGYAPNIAYLKVWGCLAKVLLPEPKKQKLGPKTFDAMLEIYMDQPEGCVVPGKDKKVGFPSVLEGFSDTNWISDLDEMKSTSGYQTCITRSTMEAEFITLEKASSEVEWLRNLLADIPLWTRPTLFMFMCYDSQAAIAKAKKLNLADPLTKPLNKKLVKETSREMRLMPITEVKSGDRAYSTLTKVECLLLMNTIFLMDGRAHGLFVPTRFVELVV
ncbi:hypothetical protein AAG906_019031 [Vitis piasezkii]